jgi:hypothetical protein
MLLLQLNPCITTRRFVRAAQRMLVMTVNVGPLAVPEPASLALFGAGLVGLLAARRHNGAPARA